MARATDTFSRGVARWSTRAVVLGTGTLLLSGTAVAQAAQPESSGPDPILVAGLAGVGAFLGALVANLAWKAVVSGGDSGSSAPPQQPQQTGAQGPPPSGGAQQPPAGGNAGGHQQSGGSPPSGGRGGQGGANRGR